MFLDELIFVSSVVVGVVPAALLILGRGRGRAAGAAEDHFRFSKCLVGSRSSEGFCFVRGCCLRVCRTFSDMVAMREVFFCYVFPRLRNINALPVPC